MIPDLPYLSDPAMPAQLKAPYNRDKSALVDFARGGVALLDASQGLDVTNWQCELDEESGECFIWAEGQTPFRVETLVEKPDWISMAFDQNMHYTLVYTLTSGHGFLYWYDPQAQHYVTDALGIIRSPIIRLDDVRNDAYATSELVLSYLRVNTLCCRVQRDRYQQEYILAENAGNIITRCGRNEKNRFQWNLM